jgi:glycosyltransferase involved in cell wall biosynthesis
MRLSIVSINYNNLRGLKATAESVWAQTAQTEFEWILVDGGSSDGAAEWMSEHSDRIDAAISEPDKGLYDAMNKGLAMARGEYVWFLNSGDRIHDSRVVERLMPLLGEPDVVYGDTCFVEPDGRELGLISQLKPQPLPAALGPGSFRFGMCLCHQSFLVKRSLAPQYNLQYRLAADIDWIIRILKQSPSNRQTDFVISDFEVGGSSYQHTKKAWRERYAVLNKHYGVLSNFFAHLWIFLRRLLFQFKLYKP